MSTLEKTFARASLKLGFDLPMSKLSFRVALVTVFSRVDMFQKWSPGLPAIPLRLRRLGYHMVPPAWLLGTPRKISGVPDFFILYTVYNHGQKGNLSHMSPNCQELILALWSKLRFHKKSSKIPIISPYNFKIFRLRRRKIPIISPYNFKKISPAALKSSYNKSL